MFKITQGKGFQMTFANGWTANVQWGPANYCENHKTKPLDWDFSEKYETWSCKNAEVSAWDANNNLFNFSGGQTLEGWKECDNVARFLLNVSQFPERMTQSTQIPT